MLVVHLAQGQLTEPVFDELFSNGTRSSICHDFKERRALAPAEAVCEQRLLVLRVSSLRSREARHACVSDLLDGDFWRSEKRSGLLPHRLVERQWISEESIGATICDASIEQASHMIKIFEALTSS